MRKTLVVAAAVVGLAVLAKRAGRRLPKIDWQQRIESMPDDSPPKWMFRNISAIRENTDRILELLGGDATPSPRPAPSAG